MKKILSFLFVLSTIFLIGLYIKPSAATSDENVAKPLICKRGKDYSEYLQYEGYTIESSNVNFYISGRYLVKYINNETCDEVYKFIYVEDMETLQKDNCYSEKYDTIKTTSEFENVYDVIELSDGSNLYAYSSESGYLDDMKDFYLVKVSQGEEVFKLTIVEKMRGIVKEIKEYNGLIYVLMSSAQDTGFLDMALYVYDLDGVLIYNKVFDGNGIDTAVKLLVDDKYIYVVGETTSNEGIFSFYHEHQSGIVIVLDKSSYDIENIYSIVVENDVTVVDACLVNNELYVVCEYFNNTISSLLYEVHIFDNSSLAFVRKAFLSYSSGTTLNMMLSYNEQIYLIYREYDSKTKLYYTRVYTYSLYGGRKKIYEYAYTKNGNASIVDVMITEDKTLVLLYNLVKVSDNYDYGYLYHIVKENEIVCEIENYSTNMASYGLINPNEILLKNNSYTYINEIVYTAFSSFKAETVTEVDEDIKLPYIYMDGKLTKPNYNRSNIEYDPHVFGSYMVDYFYEGKKQDALVDGVIIVNSYTNVYEGGIFDTDLMLNFNGSGNLNNYIVENGYVIKTPGSYTLKVIGKNDIETINFEVRDLSHSEKVLDNKEERFEEKITINDSLNDELIIYSDIDEQLVYKENIDYKAWILFLPVCALIMLGITIIKKRG